MKKLTHNETEIVKRVNKFEVGVLKQICLRLNVSKAHCIREFTVYAVNNLQAFALFKRPN